MTASTDLATDRTIMAADRTLMAWIRTALSMFSFGFTIYKLLDAMADAGHLAYSNSPRQVGLVLAGIGVVSIALGTMEYWRALVRLQKADQFRLDHPILIVAMVMSICGVALFVGIAARLL